MNKCIKYVLSTWLIIGCTYLPGIVIAQTNQENKIKTTDSATITQSRTSTYVSGITPGRARALVGVVLGLIGLIAGWRAKSTAARNAGNRAGTFVALALGLIAIVLGIVHLSSSAGAVFGSGSGKAGAIFGLLLGLIGMLLGGLALLQKKI
jgi:hypothetical protein